MRLMWCFIKNPLSRSSEWIRGHRVIEHQSCHHNDLRIRSRFQFHILRLVQRISQMGAPPCLAMEQIGLETFSRVMSSPGRIRNNTPSPVFTVIRRLYLSTGLPAPHRQIRLSIEPKMFLLLAFLTSLIGCRLFQQATIPWP